MIQGGLSPLEWLVPFQHELLLFAGTWMVVGLADELLVDVLWVWLRLRGRGRALPFVPPSRRTLRGPAAVLIPCWHEAGVIGETIAYSRAAWPHPECTFYIGCYRNDPATIAAAQAAIGDDARVRLILLPRDGPTTKADCLSTLYAEMERDEAAYQRLYRFVLLHDAEDHVHPLALDLIDERLERADFVQLPVIPELNRDSRWISGHYADEFAESHLKTMVVRDWLRTALPAAGVGCAFRREMLTRIAEFRGTPSPFAAECLTEDYELGLLVAELGGRSRFVRAIDERGELIATREFFPATLGAAERQKARWIHGIAFQGWERLGWAGNLPETWMRMRDRRGPLTALVLVAAYLAIVCWGLVQAAVLAGAVEPRPMSGLLQVAVWLGLLGAVWRLVIRAGFTAAQYGPAEGLRSVLRAPLANLITIIAARRAMAAYLRTLGGGPAVWDKTLHDRHPSSFPPTPERTR